MSSMHLVAVFVENQPGQTARVTKVLADADINICWVTIAHSGSFGVMKFLVSDSERAVRSLQEQGLMVSRIEVLVLEAPNRAGSLRAVADCLARAGINLANCSGFVANNRAVLIIETHQLAEARAALEKQGYRLLTQEEMLHL